MTLETIQQTMQLLRAAIQRGTFQPEELVIVGSVWDQLVQAHNEAVDALEKEEEKEEEKVTKVEEKK